MPCFRARALGGDTTSTVMLIQGSCHCRNITFCLDWQPDPLEIPARACTCSFCRKHGGVWTSCPTGSLSIRVADPSRVSRYTFGTRTADFHICTVCGAAPVVTSQISGKTYAVVNVNTFEGVDSALFSRAPADFGDEDEATRLSRRVRGWIPRVWFKDRGAA